MPEKEVYPPHHTAGYAKHTFDREEIFALVTKDLLERREILPGQVLHCEAELIHGDGFAHAEGLSGIVVTVRDGS